MMRAKYLWLITGSAATFVGGILAAAMVLGQPVNDDLAIENDVLRVCLDETHGDAASVFDRTKQRELLAASGSCPLWSIEFDDGTRLDSHAAGEFQWEPGSDSRKLAMHWRGFGIEGAPDLSVSIQVSLEELEPVCNWRIRVEHLGEKTLLSTSFPRISSFAEQKEETLAAPRWIGEMTHSARRLLNPATGQGGRFGWDYPGEMSMQFVTFHGNDGRGVMMSTNDTRLMRKQFAAFGDGANGVGLEVVHFAAIERDHPSGYEPPYDVVLRVIDGDWYTAAAHYRDWAKKQWWTEQSRTRRDETPDWVRDTGMWIWNRGRSPGVLKPAMALQEREKIPVSVFWHWWHGCAYDVGFPEYLPPREGTEAFRAAVQEADAMGVNSIVYMNQRLWGMTTDSWSMKDAAKYAVKRPDGTIQPEIYNTFVKAPCASMCIATPFWRDTYAALAAEAVRDLGVSGIYMDQACTSLGCYDPSHGHPLGGGSYWMEGFKLLQADIRTRCSDVKAVALAGEGCGEAWLPYLDMMLSLQVSLERYYASGDWEPAPLFNAVYHDCSIQFGNYSSLTRPPYDELWPKEFAPQNPLALLDRKFATQFRLEQARAFVWGQQPTLANFREEQLAQRTEEIEFMLRLVRQRMAAFKYLRDGVFLRPPHIDAVPITIPMSRLSIYAGQQGAVQESTKTVPTVLASAWQAADGSVAVAIVNIGDDPLSTQVVLKQSEYPLPASGAIVELTARKRLKIGKDKDGDVAIQVEVAPHDARIYEVVTVPDRT